MTTVPDIEPNFNAPWLQGIQVIASYVLATALIVVFIMLIIAILSLALRGIFPDGVRDWAGKNIVVIFIAAAAPGAISGLFQWFISFDFGF